MTRKADQRIVLDDGTVWRRDDLTRAVVRASGRTWQSAENQVRAHTDPERLFARKASPSEVGRAGSHRWRREQDRWTRDRMKARGGE